MILLYFCYTFLGVLWIIISVPCFALITLPTLLYRLVLTKVIARVLKPLEPGRIVRMTSHAIATELTQTDSKLPPRCTTVTAVVIDGSIDRTTIKNLIQRRWIEAREKESGELLYPELQQYMERWMGFMFWRLDKDFDLDNHVYADDLGNSVPAEKSHEYADDLIEELINKYYPVERSPWEIHLIYNIKYPELSPNDRKMLILFRAHHAMVDGFSVFQLLNSLFNSRIVIPKHTGQFITESKIQRLINMVKFPFKCAHDVGQGIAMLLLSENSPFHCPDDIKKGRQLYCRSPIIPLDKIKFIKNKMGCSFATVLISSISAGVAYAFKMKGFQGSKGKLPVSFVLPLPEHPNYLCNHMTVAILEILTDPNMGAVDRLLATEMIVKKSFSSSIPRIVPSLARTTSLQVAPIARSLFRNRLIPAAISNIRGPMQPTAFMEKPTLSCHFCVGGMEGVCGIMFNVLSIESQVHVAVTAEEAVISKVELQEMVKIIHEEINHLYVFASL